MMNKTQTVRLRAMEPEDLDMLYGIENDSEVWDVGENNVPYSRYILHDYIAHAQADIYVDRQVRMVIVSAEGTAVGVVDVVNFSPTHRRAEVSIIIMKAHRHKGYGQAALLQVMAYAQHTLHLHQLYAVVGEGNEASEALFRKVGFVPQTSLTDWLYDGRQYHSATLMQRIL